MGAAMTGKPIAEIMFSDFFAVCFDYRQRVRQGHYMSNGQLKCPLVVRTPAARARASAPSVRRCRELGVIPGLKVVAPRPRAASSGLLAAAVRDPDPVIFFEPQSLYPTRARCGRRDRQTRSAACIPAAARHVALALMMVPRALGGRLKADTASIAGGRCALAGAARHPDHPRLGRPHPSPVHRRGEPAAVRLGRRIVSIVADERSRVSTGRRWITTPHIPLPAADILEDIALPTVDRIVDRVRRSMQS
jgi:pyruvate dehydrogenase E1 component beta subunit